jgi:hypothetical protein
MRAREFIVENGAARTRARASHEFDVAHPGLIGPSAAGDTYWGRYYDFYRVASLAGMDLDQLAKTDDISFFGNLPIFSAYTEADRQKLIAIMKKLGMKPQEHVEPGSFEPDYVNKKSPIRSFKGYPR